MVRKPAHVDLALEAAGVTMCDLLATRLLLHAALEEIRSLQRQLRRAAKYHAHDRDQIRQLMGIDERRRHAHHEQVRNPLQ